VTWRPVDCHAHTTFSDGALSVAELVERVVARGVAPSVSDHISRDAHRGLGSVSEVRTYLDALDEYDVNRAGEFCWHDSLWRELPDDVVRRFTHRLGSLHAVRLLDGTLINAFTRTLPPGLTAERYMQAHLASLETLAGEMPVDIVAHPTLVALPFRDRDPLSIWTEEHETRMIDAMHAADIAFEISSRYPPHERIVKRAVDRGLRISLGSDGHTAEHVGDVARPLALARSLGVADDDLYDPARHGSKTQR
jgi:histidinol phosphatase-like PHP family hydrolase